MKYNLQHHPLRPPSSTPNCRPNTGHHNLNLKKKKKNPSHTKKLSNLTPIDIKHKGHFRHFKSQIVRAGYACVIIGINVLIPHFRGIPVVPPYYVGPIQFVVYYGAVVTCTLLGGQCKKEIYYLLSNPNGEMKLYEFVIIFGCFMHINLISLVLCLAYSACTTAGSIYIGAEKDYSLNGDIKNRIFGVFYAIAIIPTTYVQATIAPPVKGKMFKGLCVCYTVVTLIFLRVAISSYWTFGNKTDGLVLSNFLDEGKALIPKWFIFMVNIFIILQLIAIGVEFPSRNVIPIVIARLLFVIIATTIAAMVPFFGDINSVIGAFGFMPLDFILPVVFYKLTFKPSTRVAVAGTRQISLDAKTYRLFANV
ncbi:hypothetical protein UlMin_012320 [Ulmus minor]